MKFERPAAKWGLALAVGGLAFLASFLLPAHVPGSVRLLPFALAAAGALAVVAVHRARHYRRESRAARAHLDRALEAANVGSWNYDYENQRLWYSSNVGPMIGREPGFVHANLEAWRDDVHPDDLREFVDALRAATSGDGYELKYRVRTPWGEYRWMHVRGRLARDEEGRLQHADGIVMDVTATRSLELDRWRRSEELRTMLDLVPAGVAVAHDPAGEHITVSPAFARMLGIDDAAAVFTSGLSRDGMPYRCTRRGVEIAADQLPVAVAARTGQEVRDAELDLVFGNGRIVHLLVNAAPLFDADGERRGAIGVHVDITALKHVQNELERVSRQKDVFLATLAHELRNPLAPVRYATALLKPGAAPASIEEARRVIERQARQMSQLLDELLDMSRVTRDAIELKREPVDMARVVRQELDALRPYLTDLGHEVTLDTTQYSWVIGDSTRLHQIVSNLLSNAAKYTHMGGRIVVNVATEADTVVVRVRDSGIGIAREDLDRVFDLFSQVRRQGNVPAGGLGIGLAVVRRLVELHGGRIRASSDGAGHGAEFTVSLPRAEAPARSERRTPAEPSSRPQGVLRVLVVDDNVDAADTLAALMRMNDLDVRVAYDGVAAKEEADEFRPEVLLLDLGMPGLTGEQVARWVREQDWGDEAMLVAVTGWGQPQDRARTAAAGFDHHYVKPVEPERLLDLVNQRRARRRERAAVS